MFILLLALIFGLGVFVFTLNSFNKAKEAAGANKLTMVLRLFVLFITLLYIVVFTFVILRTLIM